MSKHQRKARWDTYTDRTFLNKNIEKMQYPFNLQEFQPNIEDACNTMCPLSNNHRKDPGSRSNNQQQ